MKKYIQAVSDLVRYGSFRVGRNDHIVLDGSKLDVFPWPPAPNPDSTEPAYGTELQALSDAARAVVPSTDWGEAYDIIKAHFDYPFFFANNPDIARLHLDPVAHYIKAGARERRDPAPWFATGEYLNHYMDGQMTMNPFHHYLTIGREKGYAPRAPHGYERFCKALDLSPAEVSDRVRARMEDVTARLAHGGLGEMVQKAAALDPLVAQSWPSALRVRVPPASNAIGTQRIAHLLDMQDQAHDTRADLVIVSGGVMSDSEHEQLRALVAVMARVVDPARIVVIATRPRYVPQRSLSGVRLIDFTRLRPKARNYDARRALIEIIRSVRPARVINHNDHMFWSAVPIYGRALAASTEIIHLISETPFDLREDSRAKALAHFYRAYDTPARVATLGRGLKSRLVEQFAVPPADADQLVSLDLPLIGETPVQAKPNGPILWLGSLLAPYAPGALAALSRAHPGRKVVAYDPDLNKPNIKGDQVWQVLPDGRLPLKGAGLVVLDADLDMLDAHALDCIGAGVPIAARLSQALLDDGLQDHAVALPAASDTDGIVAAVGAALADPAGSLDRAARLRTAMIARAPAARAGFDILAQGAAS